MLDEGIAISMSTHRQIEGTQFVSSQNISSCTMHIFVIVIIITHTNGTNMNTFQLMMS